MNCDKLFSVFLRTQQEHKENENEISHHLQRVTAILELLQVKINVEEPYQLFPGLFATLKRYNIQYLKQLIKNICVCQLIKVHNEELWELLFISNFSCVELDHSQAASEYIMQLVFSLINNICHKLPLESSSAPLGGFYFNVLKFYKLVLFTVKTWT